MKRIIAIILCLALCLCFVGCGDNGTTDSSSSKLDNSSSEKVDNTSSNTSSDNSSNTSSDTTSNTSSNNSSNTASGTTSDTTKYDETKAVTLTFGDNYVLTDAKKVEVKDTTVFTYDEATKTLKTKSASDKAAQVVVEASNGKKILYNFTVNKAKMNIVIVAGQSNASGEVTGITSAAGKYTYAACDPNTTFIWKSTSATAPVAFKGGGTGSYGTGTGTGICSALARQWTEQMKARGSNEKVTVVFGYNQTATGGIGLDDYISSSASGATADKTIKLVNKCLDYYEKGAGSKSYEVVSCGFYWFQGEANGLSYSVSDYYSKFKATWDKIKSGTSNRIDYCAFMRVRVKDSGAWGLTVGGATAAQFKLANDFDDICMGSTVTEFLNKSNASQTVTLDISNYKVMDEAQYSAIVSGNKLTAKQSDLFSGPGSPHYSCLGFNVLGADAAYNMINALYAPKDTVTLIDATGNRLASIAVGSSANIKASDIKGNLYAYLDAGSKDEKVTVSVYSGSSDITSSVVNSSYLFDATKVKAASNAKIVVKSASGKTTTFNITA